MTNAAHIHRPVRLLALAAATMLSVGLIAGPASATPTAPTGAATAHPAGFGAGYSSVINTDSDPATLEAAVQFNQQVEGGDTVATYCINAPIAYDSATTTTYTSTTWSTSGATNVPKAATLAVSSSSIGTPLADANAEATAVQLAIWKITNNLDYSSVANAAITSRADVLVAGATDRVEAASAFTLDLTATKTSSTEVALAVTFRTNTGTGQSGQSVIVTYPGGSQTVTTDTNGDASFSAAAPATAGTASATWSGVLPAGSAMVPPGATQPVITVANANITRAATAAVPAADVVTPTTPTAQPDPPAAQPTTPTTPKSGGILPNTGTWVLPVMLPLTLAVAVGGVLLMRRARRG